jgi:hypothetical protein
MPARSSRCAQAAGILRPIKYFGRGPDAQALIDMKAAGGGWRSFQTFSRCGGLPISRTCAGVSTTPDVDDPFPVYMPQNVHAAALAGHNVPVVVDYQAE